jgi:hypothetical protein
MQHDLARAAVIVGILAFALGAAAITHKPEMLYLGFLCLFVRKPKQATRSMNERFLDIEHKLEQIAQLIQRRP